MSMTLVASSSSSIVEPKTMESRVVLSSKNAAKDMSRIGGRVAGQKRSLQQCVGSAGIDYLKQSPADYVNEVFAKNGYQEETRSSPHAFVKPTEAMIAAYKMDLIQLIRTNDVQKLRQLHAEGQTLQCCNRFGESLMHMACRRGWTDLVKFLVTEAGVSLMVQDDYGRTPLHDACWTPEPNFALVDFLIKQVPELLILTDVRGHTPFNYVRKEHWSVWKEFLEERQDLLRPKKRAKLATDTDDDEEASSISS